MNVSISLSLLALAISARLHAQEPNEAILTFVDQPTLNKLDIDLDVSIIGESSATSTVSGTMAVRVNISPTSATTDELTILSANAMASEVELSEASFAGRYDLTAEEISFDLSTPEEPGRVDPATGEFEASQYEATTTGGVVGGTASTILTGPIGVPDISLEDPPFVGSADGTGTITVTPGRIEGRRFYFDLRVEFPVGFNDTVPLPDTPIPVEVTFGLQGDLVAVGETFLEYPDYAEWAAESGLDENSQASSELNPSVPNYFLHALGFDADSSPANVFVFGPEGVTLLTGSEIALDEFEIQWSDDMDTWTRVPDDAMTSGSSHLEFGDPLAEGPTIGPTGQPKYLRLARPDSP